VDVINIETNKIRRSVHTPDFPFPWVDLRQVDLSGVEGTSPAIWVIEPSGKGDYKARTKTAEELADPVAEAEDELRKLQEKAVEDIRAAIETGVDPDLVELAAIGGFSLSLAAASPEVASILTAYKTQKKDIEAAAKSIDGNLELG